MGLRKFQVSFFQTQLPVSAGVFNGSEFSNVQSAIASGMVNGAIAGGVSGAIFALINKENVLDAAISGSAMGFLVGGIVSGLKYHLSLSPQSTSSNKTGNGNDPTATAGGDGKVVEIDGKLYYIQNTPEGPVAVLIRTTPEVTVTAQANPKAQSGGGVLNDISNLTQQYTSPSADLFIGATESKIGQILLDRGKYGSLHPETIIRTPVANISLSTKLLQNTGTALKWGGRAFGAVGLVGTYAQWQTGAIGNTEAALDATFGAIGFLPGYGWAVSGAYFLIAKPLYNYSTKP